MVFGCRWLPEQCSVAIRDALRPLDVSVRQGLHTGEIERVGGTIGGIAVHVAVDRGTHSLKGVPEEWQVFAVD
jgi:hypothetical protein